MVDGTETSGLLVRVQGLLPELSEALLRIATEVLKDPGRVARSTIVELADASGTSPSTVNRFCRVVGIDGYAELRLGIAAEIGRAAVAGRPDVGTEIEVGDDLGHIARVISAADAWTIQETLRQLDLAEVGHVVDALAGARRIDIYGAGSSAVMASELQQRLHRIGLTSWFWSEVHAGLASASLLGERDVGFALSHSGRTRETIDMLTEAGARGATTVAVTNFPRSPLADVADVVLTTAVRETTFRPGTLAAQHSQLLVLDLVYVGVAQRTRRRAAQAFAVTAQAVVGHRAATARRYRT
jgi:DNA-binding MurR/RpiR family transcriptional regulator